MNNNQFPNVNLIPLPLTGGTSRMIPGWSFPESRIGEELMIKGQSVKKLLTLDLNIPDENFAQKVNSASLFEAEGVFRQNYACPHSCPGCFNEADLRNPILTTKEVWRIVDQAIELGLESVKFLGPGELIANPRLFEILDGFKKRGITISIFTKAAILGNDMLSQHYHSISSDELVDRLVRYKNLNLLIGARTFDPQLENLLVPRNQRQITEGFDYHASRNKAVERLCDAGMNSDVNAPRLALIASPVTHQTLKYVGEIYRWGALRNIPVYLPPTMVSGKGHKLVFKAVEEKFESDYIDLAVDIYTWSIKQGVMTLEQFIDEGPHPYIGVAPCNQLTHGLYIHYDGEVWRCPGNDTPDFVVHSNVRNATLLDIWKGSRNYSIQKFNNGCVKDGISLPRRFYGEVKSRVLQNFR